MNIFKKLFLLECVYVGATDPFISSNDCMIYSVVIVVDSSGVFHALTHAVDSFTCYLLQL